jgi:hypothetical protein
MPYVDRIRLSNSIVRILKNNSESRAIMQISNLEVRNGKCIGRKGATKIVNRYYSE